MPTKNRLVAPFLFLLSSTFLAGSPAQAGPRRQPDQQGSSSQRGQRHEVDLVIALDTSGSMDGLIDGARQKLWDVVNLLSQARPQPLVRVGLISYGNDAYDAQAGWVRKELELTSDLDAVQERLFALTTGGGTEYVARALQTATRKMGWSQSQDALKIVFVAGNEPANQDPKLQPEEAVKEARGRGILVNTIYCGTLGEGKSTGWARLATAGGGRYAAIDHQRVVAIATPVDAELARLSAALSGTYVAYGAGGTRRAANQLAQDKNAASASAPAAAARATAKSSALYRSDDWDLVEARAKGKKELAAMAEEELPEPMRKMKPAERKAYLDGKAAERVKLKQRIAELGRQRAAMVAKERAKGSGAAGLDRAMSDGIRAEAEAAGFQF